MSEDRSALVRHIGLTVAYVLCVAVVTIVVRLRTGLDTRVGRQETAT